MVVWGAWDLARALRQPAGGKPRPRWFRHPPDPSEGPATGSGPFAGTAGPSRTADGSRVISVGAPGPEQRTRPGGLSRPARLASDRTRLRTAHQRPPTSDLPS